MAQILLAISATEARAWENRTGSAWLVNKKTGVRRKIRYGLPGSTDIFCVAPKGVFIFIEVKTGNAVLKKNQKRFKTMVTARGHHHIIARSVSDVMEYLCRIF